MASVEPRPTGRPIFSIDETSSPSDTATWGRLPWGTRIAGTAAFALGAIGLVRGDFTIVWHPVSEALLWRTGFAYVAAILFILAGLGCHHRRTLVPAGLILCALYLLLSLGWLNRVFTLPGVIGTWLGFSEQIALAIGGVAIALRAVGDRPRAATACRVAFGVCQLIFGLGHFLSLPETIALTPAWLPPGQAFWALATGVAHFAGGVALIIGFRPVTTARLLAAMFAMFGLLVWLPLLVADLSAAVPWAGNAINLALIGAVFALGDLLARRDRVEEGAW